MRQKVDEIENECADSFASNRRSKMSLELIGVRGCRNFLIANRSWTAKLGEMVLEQFALMCIERFVFTVRIAPPIRQPCSNFSREKSAEECVARVGSRCRKNRKVVSCLRLEIRSEQRLEHSPLIETKTIDDDEYGGSIALKDGQKKFRDDVNRQRRTISLEILEPGRIMLAHVRREFAMHVGIQSAERIVEPGFSGSGKLDVPSHELVESLDPSAPVEIAIALELDCTEPLDKSARNCLLSNSRAFENLRDNRKNLPRIDRLHEIVANVRADRFLQRRILFALRDHHDGKIRRELAHVSICFQAAFPRHLLVEQHYVECATAQHLDGVVGVRRPFDVVALRAQKYAVRLQELTFVVHPEDGFGRRWHGFVNVAGGLMNA